MRNHPDTTNRNSSNARYALFVGFAFAMVFFIVSGFTAYRGAADSRKDTESVIQTHQLLMRLAEVLHLVREAESAQRGFVITGNESYLLPYNASTGIIDERLRELETLEGPNPEAVEAIRSARAKIAIRLTELANVIEARRAGGLEAAAERMLDGRGIQEMTEVQQSVQTMQEETRALRRQMIERMDTSFQRTVITIALSSALGAILSIVVVYILDRAALARRRQQWLQRGKIGVAEAVSGDKDIDVLGENLLSFLADYLGAQAGAFFHRKGSSFVRTATYGVPADTKMPEKIGRNDGLVGQAARDGKPFFIDHLPENYLTMGSALGQATPSYLAIAPASVDGVVQAVYEFGFLKAPRELTAQLLEEASSQIGVAVRSAKYQSELQTLLEQTQRQADELQSQSEELRVSNEELEEQGRVLRESQSRLEQQQAELEQTNAQLEEQAQQLETQRDDLARAQGDLSARTVELERASQYKSDFLANMSHELRTPLNSSLILAKLLADNPEGNLTGEQVEFAKTIESSGNDLLVLINDILDLSKIEAGHMEIHPATTPMEWLGRDLQNLFEPIAQQKSLELQITIDPDAPKSIETDRQRLQQILKNLLSNAFKFTDSGKVELAIRSVQGKRVAFSVSDTGVGISPEKQQAIFEAFRQADSTTSRKYGGTGLGLSISKELARLLGGRIELESELGRGSTFTLYLPENYAAAAPRSAHLKPTPKAPPPVSISIPEPQVAGEAFPLQPSPASRVQDDREKLRPSDRLALIVEDDDSFARILVDIARKHGFQCLVAGTAEEALSVCKQYLPHAVVLDVGLPDNSGLSVLDRLKRDSRTRHIPVHVVSAGDYEKTALSLGAVGYLPKPVKREQLEAALEGIERRLTSNVRRVLLVEDDRVQRESVKSLLNTRDVNTVAVGSAAACLEKLKAETFDCMILDLSLPDSDGYALLETLSQEPDYSFPPVIVYTGSSLTTEDEQRLRRYSKSIIIKGAKSPERLLDEVTLFLHQVVSDLPPTQRKMLEKARRRDAVLEGRRILVVEDDIRNVYAVTNILEPLGAIVQIARNGREALAALDKASSGGADEISLILMDVMMPEMDGLTATFEIRKRPEWQKLPIIMLTAKAMRDDQERCMEAGANDYMAKPLDVDKLVSLVRVWMPR